jgi:hypothetical protein
MSGIVELAFRQELVKQFFPELGERIYDNAHPSGAGLPLAMYRRIGAGERPVVYGGTEDWLQARIQLTLMSESYSEVKRLQQRIERFFAAFRGRMGRAAVGGAAAVGGVDAECCPVEVRYVQVITMPDFREPSSRARLAISDYIFRYQE